MKTTIAGRVPSLLRPANVAATPEGFVGLIATDRVAREEILHRAYAIWENQGRPESRELSHWLEVEAAVFPR